MPEPTGDHHSALLEAGQIAQIEKELNLEHVSTSGDFLTFNSNEKAGWRQRGIVMPIEAAEKIVQAINRGASRMTEYEGWVDPDRGFAEFEINQNGINAFRVQTVERFTFDTRSCVHEHAHNPPLGRDEDRDYAYPVIRVTSSDGSTCMEISPNSALCVPLMQPGVSERESSRSQTTLKIYLRGGSAKLALMRQSRELANSFLFELNARHRCAYSLRPKRESLSHRRRGRDISYSVRFPRTPVPDNVATLFSIPSEFTLRGNSTLFYLSYYQILEHYLPAVQQRETVRKVRRILRSLDFEEGKDSSVLQIVNSVARSRGASEGEQLQNLIEECVPGNKLAEFFAIDHGGHFGSKGPISGVHSINAKSGESLASQVAKRIYMLRNRIVHAKDDVRFAESKVLLPLSPEAMRLYPDIELIRDIAIEVIADNR